MKNLLRRFSLIGLFVTLTPVSFAGQLPAGLLFEPSLFLMHRNGSGDIKDRDDLGLKLTGGYGFGRYMELEAQYGLGFNNHYGAFVLRPFIPGNASRYTWSFPIGRIRLDSSDFDDPEYGYMAGIAFDSRHNIRGLLLNIEFLYMKTDNIRSFLMSYGFRFYD